MSTGINFAPPHGVRFENPKAGRNPAWVFALVVAFLALLIVSALIVTTSRAAFTAQTDNIGNSFTAGDVVLVDDDLTASRFTVVDMEPGSTITRCIRVTYNGSLDPSPVKLYSGGFTDSGNFGDYLNVTVDEGNGGDFSTCTGFVEDDAGAEFTNTLTFFGANHTNYGNGVGEWDPSASGQFKTYQITVALDAATPDAEQNESVTALTFTWEVQS